MVSTLIKTALGAGLAVATVGGYPATPRSGIVAIGAAVVAALILHFVAP